MASSRVFRIYRYLAWAAAGIALLVGVGELLFAGGSLAHRALFCLSLSLCAALVLVGLRIIPARPWPGFVLVVVGSVAAGVQIFWTVLAPLLAIALVVLGVVVARRLSAAKPLT